MCGSAHCSRTREQGTPQRDLLMGVRPAGLNVAREDMTTPYGAGLTLQSGGAQDVSRLLRL